jgi:hypothetical protein
MRRRACLLSGLVFLHLKKDLDVDTLDWIDCQDPSEHPARNPLTTYWVQKKVQRQLAAIRTDLDSFSDTARPSRSTCLPLLSICNCCK